MDRLNRTMAGYGLMLLLAAGGCRSTKPEVPPGRPYTGDGRQAPPIDFSTDPHPMTGPGITTMPGAQGTAQFGTPGTASAGNYGAPTGNQYGPPGTTLGSGQMPPGMGGPPQGQATEATSMPPTGLGAPSTGGVPLPGSAPGMMGVPGQAPSPL